MSKAKPVIGWKAVSICVKDDIAGTTFVRKAILKVEVLGTIVVPRFNATVYSPKGGAREVKKFRTNKFKVLAAYRPRTLKPIVLKEGEFMCSTHMSSYEPYIYKVGRIHKPANGFSTDTGRDCAPGLYFFANRNPAEDWDV